ncbi:MAG: ABC1 kinase family protein [Pseudomonadota bacterium]
MNLLNTGKDLRRLNEIGSVLWKYGFSDLVERLDIHSSPDNPRLFRFRLPREIAQLSTAERARRALEEMGPTFVKLGQILATRVDLFPADFIHELEKLQDSAPAVPFAELKAQVETALGKPVEQVFAQINEKPLGSASMAQVHRARTRRGEEVVLKIQRPGIGPVIETDLRLMDYFARLLHSQFVELRRYRPIELVEEFRRSLMRELDFTQEARNAERIADNLKGFEWLKVPKVYNQYSSATLNVQEFVDGIPAKNIAAIDAAGLDRKLIARRGCKVVWKSIFEDGFFHADPHPGNIILLPGNRICLIDFGMVGKISALRREQLVRLIKSVIMQDANLGASVLLEWADGIEINLPQLVSDLEDLMSQYYGLKLAEVDIAKLLLDVIAVVQRHDLQFPSDIALLSKATLTLEGFGRGLDPDIDLIREAEPLLLKLFRDRYNPVKLARKLGNTALRLVDRLYEDPAANMPGVKAVRTPQITPRQMSAFVTRLEKAQHRNMLGVLVAGLSISSAILLTTTAGPTVFDINLLHVLGTLGLVGVWIGFWWLLGSMWQSRKDRL